MESLLKKQVCLLKGLASSYLENTPLLRTVFMLMKVL